MVDMPGESVPVHGYWLCARIRVPRRMVLAAGCNLLFNKRQGSQRSQGSCHNLTLDLHSSLLVTQGRVPVVRPRIISSLLGCKEPMCKMTRTRG